ncbi:MAG: transglycosylase domain-containing protein [Spirochaetia bacterium]|jgi:penicillin-binding protein 1A|nr:transglycosylase domain-containing protein [Spirochaetia bacterium]
MKLLKFIFAHRKFFIGLPLLVVLAGGVYTGVVYVSWLGNKDAAMERLSRYKQLIDRTEEMRKGYVYSSSDVDVSAKAVDLPTRIYDRHDDIIGEFFDQKREIVPYDFIPEWIVKGVIASEDRDFYKHRGINYRGILRAILVNIVNFDVVQGGSTISQQLGKVLFTDMERSLKRKIYEAFCAYEIERRYDKQDILSMYLNLIYFSNGAYGVESAAKMFFGKSINQCDIAECAVIVATISSPRMYSPISNLDNSLRKTKRIMGSMVDAGFITQKQADYQYDRFVKKWEFAFDDKQKAVSSSIGSFIFSSYRINRAPFFNEQIRRLLVEKFGEDAVKKGGLSIYTTIDGKKQDAALENLRAGIAAQREYHKKAASAIKDKGKADIEAAKAANIEGALVSINPFTGEIICYAGGYEFSSSNQNDNVQQILRQPGSSFKPVIYAAAVQDKDITPSTVFQDEPVTFKGGYSPKNYSLGYSGDIIIREALRKSVNIVAVKVLDKTGYDRIFSIIRSSLDLPDAALKKRFGKTLSLALGTYEVSPLENCVLHSVIVNGGDYVKPFGIRYVKDYNGNIVWDYAEEAQSLIKERRDKTGKIIDPRAAAVIISMLKGVFEKGGTAYYAAAGAKLPVAVAGKTGTSTDYNDAWFAGYAPDLVTVVWVGNKQGAISLGRGRSGGSVAAPVWGKFAARTLSNEGLKDFAVPKGVSRERICLESGKVAGDACPETAWQLFYEGSEPDAFCRIHSKPQSAL